MTAQHRNRQSSPEDGDAWRAFWEHARWMVDRLWAYSVHIQTKANWLLAGSVVALAFAGRWVADASLDRREIYLPALLAVAGWLSAVFCCVMVLRLGRLSTPYPWSTHIYGKHMQHARETGESPSPEEVWQDLTEELLTATPGRMHLGENLHREIKMRARWLNLAIWSTMAGLALSALTVIIYLNTRP